MDRRKLIVGGGAAAVATTLGAVAGTGLPAQAAPARARLRPASTADHARMVLEEVRVELGLVNPEGLRRRYQEGYAELTAAPPREPRPDDVETWIRRRLLEFCGTDSYLEALTKHPGARTLLAFGFLVQSQNQDKPLPRLEPGLPVPPVFEKLEPDFLPVLLGLVEEKRRASREFAAALDATSALLDQIIAEQVRYSSGGGKVSAQAAPTSPSAGDALGFALGVAMIIVFFYWVKGELKL